VYDWAGPVGDEAGEAENRGMPLLPCIPATSDFVAPALPGTVLQPTAIPEHARMSTGSHARPRRALWIAGACLAIAALGVGLFALAFRDCRFAVEPGRALAWSLSISSTPVRPDGSLGAERVAEHRLVLVGLGPEVGTAAWLAGPADGVPASVQLVDLPSDGRIRLRAADGRQSDTGPSLSGFDFNLLPLPMGAEQEWKPEVVWAALPPGHRSVACSAKRLRSGAVPQFRCDFPVSVEWVDPATGRYRQVRDLKSTYRFDTLRGIPREAEITFTMRDELPPPGGFVARKVALRLAWQGSESGGVPADLREMARVAAQAETWVAARRAPPPELLNRLRAASGPFHGLAEGLMARLGGTR
jgi:hypothetical protein